MYTHFEISSRKSVSKLTNSPGFSDKMSNISHFQKYFDFKKKIIKTRFWNFSSFLGNVYTFGCNDEGALGRKIEEEEESFNVGQ